MVFDLYDTERIEAWKVFRDSLETSNTPFEDVADFWTHAPFVGNYLNPHHPKSWPDPWKLILDGKFDDLGLVLGMLHTIKLTEKFAKSRYELCSAQKINDNQVTYFLIVDNYVVLNFEYNQILFKTDLPDISINLLWTC